MRNECKELLIVAKNGRQKALYGGCEHDYEPKMYCVDDGNVFSYSLKEAMEHSAVALATLPMGDGGAVTTYLYVPNSAVMKAGCFHVLASHYAVDGVGPNSHLFVAGRMIDGFPGRVFRIIAVSSMNKRELKRSLAGVKHANIATRNFPMSVETLRKRLKVTDGGDVYIFATTVADGSQMVFPLDDIIVMQLGQAPTAINSVFSDKAETYVITDLQGNVVSRGKGERFTLPSQKGVYIISSGDKSRKILVKSFTLSGETRYTKPFKNWDLLMWHLI